MKEPLQCTFRNPKIIILTPVLQAHYCNLPHQDTHIHFQSLLLYFLPDCPKDWIKLGRKCYKFEDNQVEDFAGAVIKCDEMDSKLILPQNAVEEFNIKQYIKGEYPKIKGSINMSVLPPLIHKFKKT